MEESKGLEWSPLIVGREVGGSVGSRQPNQGKERLPLILTSPDLFSCPAARPSASGHT